MLKNPRLKYCYHAEFLDDDTVILSSETDSTVLTGERYVRVLSEIDEHGLSMDALAENLKECMTPMDVFMAIQILETKGYLTEATPQIPEAACSYWNTQGMDVPRLSNILQSKTISLEFVGVEPLPIFRNTFESLGIHISKKGSLTLVVTDDYAHPDLTEFNRNAIAEQHPWMLVKPVGVEIWFGPMFIPGKTGCWECLHQRLEINFPIYSFYQTQKDTNARPPKPLSGLPLTFGIGADLAALEIVKWLYHGKNEHLEGRLVSFDTQALKTESHELVKRPQCHTCGDGVAHQLKPVILEKESLPAQDGLDRKNRLDRLGGYREISPEETLRKYFRHVSPITGVVQELKPYHRMNGAPVFNFSSGHNLAFRSKNLFWLNQHIRSASGGKGKTPEQAKTGALCEAIERYSLAYQGDEHFIRSTFEALGDKAIHPNTCMNYSDRQFENRLTINRDFSHFYALVPIPFETSRTMEWVPVYSLTEKTFKYLPASFCYAQYPAEDEHHPFAFPDSNGCAAGNSIEEAILQGFLELVERDSVAQWWYNCLRKPGVDLTSWNNSYFTRLQDFYHSRQRSLYVLDLTADLGIPTFGALSHRQDGDPQNVVFGFGAHVDAEIALERALVELNQLLPIANVPEAQRAKGEYLTRDRNFVNWLNEASLEKMPYLAPDPDIPPKRTEDFTPLCPPTIPDSVRLCIRKAEERGLETLVLDLTRPDIGLPVVKVIVPGMRHFWPRLGPGRLYDVPFEMGLLDRKLKEDELNPIGLFI